MLFVAKNSLKKTYNLMHYLRIFRKKELHTFVMDNLEFRDAIRLEYARNFNFLSRFFTFSRFFDLVF